MTGERTLEIANCKVDGHETLCLCGELDMESCPAFREAVAALQAAGQLTVAVDLSRVSFLDATGFQALCETHLEMAGRGGGLIFTNPSAPVTRTYDLLRHMAGLDGPEIGFRRPPAAALEWLRRCQAVSPKPWPRAPGCPRTKFA